MKVVYIRCIECGDVYAKVILIGEFYILAECMKCKIHYRGEKEVWLKQMVEHE